LTRREAAHGAALGRVTLHPAIDATLQDRSADADMRLTARSRARERLLASPSPFCPQSL
jgi:hypothetical protein